MLTQIFYQLVGQLGWLAHQDSSHGSLEWRIGWRTEDLENFVLEDLVGCSAQLGFLFPQHGLQLISDSLRQDRSHD